MHIDYSRFKDLYLQTAKEYLAQLTSGIVTFLDHPSDAELVKSLHIAAHSLKGQSLAIGFPMIGRVSYILEKIFYGVKEEGNQVSPELGELMKQATTSLGDALQAIEDHDKETDMLPLIEKLEQVSGIQSQA